MRATRTHVADGPGKGWTPQKRRAAYTRFGQIIISLAAELDVPANELLTFVLKGDVPPSGRADGFADTVVLGLAPAGPVLALAAPAIPEASFEVIQEPGPRVANHRRPPPPPRVFNEAGIEQLRRLAGTMSVDALAVDLGVSRSSLYRQAAISEVSLAFKAAPRRPQAKRQRYSEEQIGAVRVGAGRKLTARQISRETELTRYAVSTIALENDIKLLSRGGVDRSVWPDDKLAELRRLASIKGNTAKVLADHFEVSRNSVVGAAHHHNIPLLGGRGIGRPKLEKPAGRKAPAARSTSNVVKAPQPPAPPVARPIAGDDQLLGLPSSGRRGTAGAGTAWVRFQHPDGRWLRIDGLDLVSERDSSFIVRREKAPAARRAFPLARECTLVDQPAWTPRDGIFGATVREMR